MELSEKRSAIITGASSGIGAAIARALSERGVGLTLIARREERLKRLAAELPGEAAIAPLDLRDEAALVGAFAEHAERFGGLDILVNNAGIGREAPMHGGASEAWRAMWEVNVLALCLATREALARFPESGGHIINISSLSGHRVPPSGGFYAATKHAVKAINEVTRLELRARDSRTRLTSISPGLVKTEFFEGYLKDPEDIAALHARVPEMLRPDDIAAAALHAIEAPGHVEIHDILLRPTIQQS